MKSIIALVCMVSLGCGLPDRYTLTVDPAGFTDEQIDSIFRAADEWTDAVPIAFGKEVAHCGSAGMNQVCVHAATTSGENTGAGGMTHTGEAFPPHAADVYLFMDHLAQVAPGPVYFHEAILHELGHAQGLKHESGNVLMNPQLFDQAPTITKEDRDQWYDVR